VKQLKKDLNLSNNRNIKYREQLEQLQKHPDENKIMKNNNNTLLKKNKALNQLTNELK
jgi:hypothetical protein